MREKLELTEADGYAALQGHVVERARKARASHGPDFDERTLRALLADPEVVRFPTALTFSGDGLLAGEFAWAAPLGEKPTDGFALRVHPHFEGRWDVLPLLVAYHIVSINYLDVVTHEEAELFGATLLGMELDDYYGRICQLADSIPGAPVHDPSLAEKFESVGCGGSCSCAGGA